MQILILIASTFVVSFNVVRTDDLCEPKTGVVTCQIEVVTSEHLSKLPKNCTTLLGDLLIQGMTVLPKKINVLSNLWYIRGALIIKNTNFDVVNFTFLNNVRCIDNENGPAIILEENFNLYTIGLKKIAYIAAEGEPVFSMVGDSYLYLAGDQELKSLVVAASTDGHYHDGLFSVSEVAESYENVMFYISFFAVSSVVALIILAGHFVFQLHVPKGSNSNRSGSRSNKSSSSSTVKQTHQKSSVRSLTSPVPRRFASKRGR